MACTTILVGKNASYDGSCIIARNDDCASGQFTVKKFTVVDPKDQPRQYKSVISGVEIELPNDPMRYTACPNVNQKEGIWAACGVNEANVAMTATETITSNPRVLGAIRWLKTESGKKISLRLPCRIFIAQKKEWNVLENFLKSTEHTK